MTKKLIIFATGWNFIGNFIPLIVGLFAIPLLIKGMGTERFGLLTLLWMGLGYFSLFDFGLGRALTKFISEKINPLESKADVEIVWTALITLSAIGLFFSFLLLIFSEPLLEMLLPSSSVMRSEGLIALKLLALGIPVVTLSAGLIGILEGLQSFKSIAFIRMPLGVMTFLAPLIVLYFTENISWIICALLVSRLMALFALLSVLLAGKLYLFGYFTFSFHKLKPLVTFGGWVTVSNIVGPLMTYLDRFYIGPGLGLSSLAYYTVPYDILIRLQIIPQSIMGAMFPSMVVNKNSNIDQYMKVYEKGGKIAFFIMFPVFAIIFLMAPEWLMLWLGKSFSENSFTVVQLLCVGWLINLTAQPGILSLMADGRPDLISKLLLVEFIPYILLLTYLSQRFGINGVAAAWTIRVSIDALAINFLVYCRNSQLKNIAMQSSLAIFYVILFFILLLNVHDLNIKVLVSSLILMASSFFIYKILGKNIIKNFLSNS